MNVIIFSDQSNNYPKNLRRESGNLVTVNAKNELALQLRFSGVLFRLVTLEHPRLLHIHRIQAYTGESFSVKQCYRVSYASSIVDKV